MVRNFKNIIFFLTSFFIFLNLSHAERLRSWPKESESQIQNENYGQGCSLCTQILSRNYCAASCCESCQIKAKSLGLSISGQCAAVCNLNLGPLSTDLNYIKRCKDSNYSEKNCELLERYDNLTNSADYKRMRERRTESCDEAVVLTRKYCVEQQLNRAYPADLFRLAQQIVNAPSCDLGQIEDYNLKSQGIDPNQALDLCEKNFNDCKTYCYDQNVVRKDIAGQTFSDTYFEGQKQYEKFCGPLYNDFNTKKALRDQYIAQANDKVTSCGGDYVGVDTEETDGSEDEDLDFSDDAEATEVSAETEINPKPVKNPQTVANNLNQFVSAFSPYLNTGGDDSSNYNYNSELGQERPSGYRPSGLSDYEKYGPDYSGYDPGDTSDLDFAGDLPPGLKATEDRSNSNPRGNGGMFGGGAGGGMGSLGGSSGSNPNSPQKNSGTKRGSKKEKTLFGKLVDASNTYEIPGEKRGQRPTRSDFNLGKNQKRMFDASKYHNAIMASYDKGLTSKAQKLAERRAAGYKIESFEDKRASGYTSWHIENKIHPERVSIFMQAKLCYHIKFSSGFKKSCEFKRP